MRGFHYTIPSVLDCETGEEVFAEPFFRQAEATIFGIRRQLEDAIHNRRDPKYKCYYCNQLIKIRGKAENETKLKRMHFAHQWDSDDCPIKTSQELTQQQIRAIKYNGQKESLLHQQTKELVAASLESNRASGKGVTEVATETVRQDKSGLLTWRKPDVSAVYHSRQIVFEIQLSTTFLSVIADREHFYQKNQTFIIWIFKFFSDDAEKQRFTEKDVFYGNNQNAFVLDEEAINESKQQKDLILKCLYREPYRSGRKIVHRWQERLVGLHDLTFNEKDYKLFFFDVEGATTLIRQEIEAEERAEAVRQLEFELQQQAEEKRRQIQDDKLEEGFSRARFTIYQSLVKVAPYPEQHSPLLKIFADFTPYSQSKLFDLFGHEKGYQPNVQDKAFLNAAFIREKANRSHLERDDLLTCLCLTTCLIKLEAPYKAHRLQKVVGFVMSILSVKLNCVVGQKYQKLIQVAHTVFSGKISFAHLFLRALEVYPNSGLIEQDIQSGGKLAKKITAYQQKNVKLDQSYDDVFKLLFPELFAQ